LGRSNGIPLATGNQIPLPEANPSLLKSRSGFIDGKKKLTIFNHHFHTFLARTKLCHPEEMFLCGMQTRIVSKLRHETSLRILLQSLV
jgi:hypothetical protein